MSRAALRWLERLLQVTVLLSLLLSNVGVAQAAGQPPVARLFLLRLDKCFIIYKTFLPKMVWTINLLERYVRI
jgi:hypothetical protein